MADLQVDIVFKQAVDYFHRHEWFGAETKCRQVLLAQPRHLGALSLLAHVALERSRPDEAEALMKRCAAAEPRNPEFHTFLARVYGWVGRHDQAVNRFDRALRIEPHHDRALAGKVRALYEKGDAGRAMEVVDRWLARHDETPVVAAIRAELLVKARRLDEAIALAEGQLAGEIDSDFARRDLWSQIGRARELSGEHDAAFEAYRKSNEAVRQPFPADRYFDLLARMKATFTRDLMSAMPRPRKPSDLPVFVVGFARSGTTLVDRIIDAHPQAIGLVETVELARIARNLTLSIGSTLPWPESASDLDAEDIETLSDDLVGAYRRRARRAIRASDKSIENWRVLGLAAALCPAARAIHVRRDPLDTCVSCFFERLHPTYHPYSNDLGDVGRVHRAYEGMMEHWKAVLDFPILEVDYEQLAADPEPQIRRIIEFCDLPWDDACLQFHATGRAAPTISHDQVRRPMYTSSVARWRKYEKHLGPLREALGV